MTPGSPVRPALFPSAFSPSVGGVEELTRQLAIAQLRAGKGPTVVANRWPRDLPEDETVDGVPVRRIAFRALGPTPRHIAGYLSGHYQARAATVSTLRRRESDLVHVQCVSSNAPYALAAARSLGLPLVVTAQGEFSMDANHTYERSPAARRMLRRVLGEADAITGCSQYVIDELSEFTGGAEDSKMSVVYNGIDLAEYEALRPEKRERPYILGLGRLVQQKGFDVLIAAFGRVAPDHPDLEMVIAGDGPERAALERHAVETGLADRIQFLGYVDHGRALSLFAGAEMFVLCSRHEPQGIVVLEAMAAGTPVIASEVGGVPEVVNGDNGLLFPAGDSEALAERMTAILESPAAIDRLTLAASSTVQDFSWTAIATQYDDVYAKACRTR